MVTLKMISEETGLSIAAVSKALNHLPGVNEERAEEVRRTARELGYIPNEAARSLKTSRSKNIGVVYQNDMCHELFSKVLTQICRVMAKHDYDVTFLANGNAVEGGYYTSAIRRGCDGVIVVQGLYGTDELRRLALNEIPVVSIDDPYEGCTLVANDNEESMARIVRYLHGLGHRRIAFIHGEDGSVTRARLTGFRVACAALGIEAPDEYIRQARYQEPGDSGREVRALLKLPERPTCILFPDDVSYLGGMSELDRQGLSVPGDMSCFGYDGIRLTSLLRPQLATYRQDAEKIGSIAAQELLLAIKHPESYKPKRIVVPGCIEEGATVARLAE